MTNKYLARYGYPQPQFNEYHLSGQVDIIVVIPCYKEKNLNVTLDCLNQCDISELQILVIVVVNESELSDYEALKTNEQTIKYLERATFNSFALKFCRTKLSLKKAGVGLARKIGMDEAIRFYDSNNTAGIIACFDADSTCEPNYFQAIKGYFQNTKKELGLVYYEHPLDQNKDSIVDYELFLRYYTDSLRFAGFPYAYQTLGSCIIVDSNAYQKYGGMAPRQAGEDFYFINKIAMHGKVGEINDTTVFPSSRISDRVPFGTGDALGKMKNGLRANEVYNPEIFLILKSFLTSIFSDEESIFNEMLTAFLIQIKFEKHLSIIEKETKNPEQFEMRFFQWFDAFKILKLTHFLDKKMVRVPVDDAINWLGQHYYQKDFTPLGLNEKLHAIRSHNKKYKLN
ncbi:MAG: glycosyltransferase family A protein [Cyclobacteriaceae bacterium]